MASSSTDYVYARQIFRCGEGYPLWLPEPNQDGEVMIGDVGYLHRGAFYRMFNATLDKEDPVNDRLGVPEHFERFVGSSLAPRRVEAAVAAGPLLSDTLQWVGEEHPNATSQAGGYHYKCTDDQGAFVVLETPGVREIQNQVRKMKNYMSKNISSWHSHAVGKLGLEIDEEDILFVRGFVKTTRWGLAACTDHGKTTTVKIHGDLSQSPDTPFEFDEPESKESFWEQRLGPENRYHQEHPLSGSQPNQSKKPDQCIFLHYFKIKRRLFFIRQLQAAAEARDLLGDSDDLGSFKVESGPTQKPYDPVGYVLDYILRNSEAEAAIASDVDISQLCKANPEVESKYIPDDIASFLEQTQPHIEVTEDGLGMLSIGDADENVAESAEFVSQATGSAPLNDATTPLDDVVTQAAETTLTAQAARNTDVNEDVDMDDEKDARKGMNFGDSLLQLSDEDHRGSVCALAYSPNGLYVAAGFEDSSIIVWNAASRQQVHVLQSHSDAVCSLAFAPNSSELASGSRDARIIVWGVIDGDLRVVLRGHTGFVNSIAYSPDGRKIASASVDFTICLWDVETGRMIEQLGHHDAMVMHVVFSPDGSRLVSAGADGIAQIWNTEDTTRIAELDGHEGVIYSVSFSPDGRRLVTSSDDGKVQVWSAVSGEVMGQMHEHSGSVWAATFSSDGNKVLSVASERIVNISESFSGDLVSTINEGEGLVSAATFSPSGKFIAAGAEDHSVQVWNTETRAQVAKFDGHTDNVSRLRFSPDSKRIVSASEDSTVRIWDLGPQ